MLHGNEGKRTADQNSADLSFVAGYDRDDDLGQAALSRCRQIFPGDGEERGKSVISFKLEMKHAAEIIELPNFWRAPYVGHKGWVSMDVRRVSNWDDVRGLILESYRLIAPKRTLASLEGGTGRRSSMALSPSGMGDAVIRNLRNRTGRNLEQWVKVARRSRLTDPKELRKWLKAEHVNGRS